MSAYEYKTVAAPRRAGRFRGVSGQAERFARTLEEALAEEAVDGWEFQRAENLPCEEKSGFLSRRETVFHSILVFRRAKAGAQPRPAAEPGFAAPQPAPAPGAAGFAEPQIPAFQRQGAAPADPDAALDRVAEGQGGPRLGGADR